MNPYTKMYLITESDKINLDDLKAKGQVTCDQLQQQHDNTSKIDDLNKSLSELKQRYDDLVSVATTPAKLPTLVDETTPATLTTTTPVASSSNEKLTSCKQKLKKCYKDLEECRIEKWQSMNGDVYVANDGTSNPNTRLLSFSHTPISNQKVDKQRERPKRDRKQTSRLKL